MAEAAGNLDDAIIGLGAGVAEKDATWDADDFLDDELGEAFLLADGVEVGAVHQAVRLLAESIDDDGVAVPQAAGGDAGAEIHIASAFRIKQV